MNELYIGTSAYKLEEYESQVNRTREQSTQKKAGVKADLTSLYRFLIISIIAIFAVASALVYTTVMTLRASTKVAGLEKQLAVATEVNKQKEIEINKKLDMKVVEKRAIEELGMQKPENSQIIYIDVKKSDNSGIVTSKKETPGFVNGIKGFINDVVEYFN